jgi:hypothetical protein
MIPKNSQPIAGSFRDPSGFLFKRDGQLFRQINQIYATNYQHLMSSGLYQALVDEGLLIPHVEVAIEPAEPQQSFRIIQPEVVDFVSYPYEWSFSQLKNAALTTLLIQERCLKFGTSLKDASAYNIQFHKGRPLLIDTLSFEIYQPGKPWGAYRQFCQHFLAPLALMALRDVRLNQLLRIYLDGVPLDLASRLLPLKSRMNFGLLSHIHFHAQAQKRYAGQRVNTTNSSQQMSQLALMGLVDSLKSTVQGLSWHATGTEWADYYGNYSYTAQAFEAKKQIVNHFLDDVAPGSVWDQGANTGIFSRLASQRGIFTVSFDVDPGAVEQNYLAVVENQETSLLPLIMDLTNPSPSVGWQNQERLTLLERGPVDAVFALALIHHLAISNNVPLPGVAAFLARMSRQLLIEFVPKDDPQVKKLLANREDIFPEYTQPGFEKAFSRSFEIHRVFPLPDSSRLMYFMKSRF